MRIYRADDLDPQRPADPNVRLWGKVLLLGIRDAVAERLGRDRDFPASFPSARRWIWNDADSSVGSFLWICQCCGMLDISSIRSFVETADEEELDRLRHSWGS